jgi:xylose isomerase
MWSLIKEAINKRYAHWDSEMRDEMLQGIKLLEKQIEAKHFSQRIRQTPRVGDKA